MYKDIFVPIKKINKAKNGDKVLVSIEEWPEKADSPFGKVLKVLGKPGEHNTEIHSILAEYGLPYEFPKEVEDFANALDTSITKKEIASRITSYNVCYTKLLRLGPPPAPAKASSMIPEAQVKCQ